MSHSGEQMIDIHRLNHLLLDSIVESKDKRIAEALAQRDEVLAILMTIANEITLPPHLRGPIKAIIDRFAPHP